MEREAGPAMLVSRGAGPAFRDFGAGSASSMSIPSIASIPPIPRSGPPHRPGNSPHPRNLRASRAYPVLICRTRRRPRAPMTTNDSVEEDSNAL